MPNSVNDWPLTVDDYDVQLEKLLDIGRLVYTDEDMRIELHKATEGIYIFNTFEGPFVSNRHAFDWEGETPDFLALLKAMELVAPLRLWALR